MIKEFDLNDEQIAEIKTLFEDLNALKELAKDSSLEGRVVESITEKLFVKQKEFTKWFNDIEAKLDVNTTPQNSWNVDFDNKKLQLV